VAERPLQGEICGWIRHTTGIGRALLERAGWQPGQGLGAASEGIALPLDLPGQTSKVGIACADGSDMPSADDNAAPDGNEAPLDESETAREKAVAWKDGGAQPPPLRLAGVDGTGGVEIGTDRRHAPGPTVPC
jgi:hypothetical protein